MPTDDDKENKRRHHQHGSVSSNDSINSSTNDIYDDDEASYAAQVEHLQEYQDTLFDSYQEILTNRRPIYLNVNKS